MDLTILEARLHSLAVEQYQIQGLIFGLKQKREAAIKGSVICGLCGQNKGSEMEFTQSTKKFVELKVEETIGEGGNGIVYRCSDVNEDNKFEKEDSKEEDKDSKEEDKDSKEEKDAVSTIIELMGKVTIDDTVEQILKLEEWSAWKESNRNVSWKTLDPAKVCKAFLDLQKTNDQQEISATKIFVARVPPNSSLLVSAKKNARRVRVASCMLTFLRTYKFIGEKSRSRFRPKLTSASS